MSRRNDQRWDTSKSAWGNTTQRTQRQHQRPPGLKGRAIGLFYRDRQKANRQFKRDTKKEIVISFNLPPAVKSQVYASLKYIYEKAAKKQNIEIIEVNLPEFAKEFPVGGISRCHGRPQPIPSLATSNHHVITQPTASTSNINSSDAVYYADITFEDDDIYIYDEKDSTFKIPEPITQTKYIPDKDSPLKKPEPKSETKYLEPQEPQPGTSSSQDEDFIALKNENPDDYVHEERIASLRGGAGDYKYSYKDIITETFDEKLSKSFAKGVNIALRTDMVIELSGVLYDEYQNMLTKHNYKKMMEFRRTLPTYKKRDDLLDVIRNNQVIVISGETGCGKSTQVPQLILDEAIANKRGGNVSILVTQPRRIAASSLAQRVAEERAERMGNSVGYAVRLEKVEARPRGSVMFCTTGILLAELEVNQSLTNYSHIILDEVHERDCHIDISMCMLKKVLNIRKDLKLILMSATIDAEKLSEYFNNCPMMHIEGLAYPVTDVYLEEILYMTGYRLPEVNPQTRGKWNRARGHEEERAIKHRSEVGPWLESIKRNIHREVYHTLLDYRSEDMNMELMCNLLIYIGRQPPGAVLVFLPGIGEITKLMREMKESGMFPTASYEIYPLHSKLPSLEQRKIFERPKMGVRKIIIATNIAETSITIDDIVYVVDCGKIKISGLNVEENVVTLQVEWVSQANLRQRRGRAGRCQPGICYHMLTSFRASKIRERLLPELQRSNLLEPVLTVKRLRLGIAAKAFEEMPSPPDFSTVQWAVKHLHQCGALDASETLTPLGWHLARLPVHPAAGKLLLLGALFGCLDRAASVAAVWGFKDPFQLVIGKEDEVDNMKRRFALGEPSDHVAISEALIQWERCPAHNQRSFAYNHYLSNNTLELLSDMKRQLGESLRNMGFMPTPYVKAAWENRNMSNISLFKAVVAAALYPNTASVRWTKPHPRKNKMPRIKVNTTEDVKRVNVHPSSVMSAPNFSKPGQPPVQLCHTPGANWLVYWLKQRSTDLYLIEVTLVYTLPLLFFGELKVSVDENAREDECLMCISTVKVRCQRDTATLLFRLRSLLDQVLATKVTSSIKNSSEHTEFEKSVLNAVTQLITAEDEQVTYVECDDDDSPSDHSEN